MRQIYTSPDSRACALCYLYSETCGDHPEPEGLHDLSASGRPEALHVREALLACLDEKEEQFYQASSALQLWCSSRLKTEYVDDLASAGPVHACKRLHCPCVEIHYGCSMRKIRQHGNLYFCPSDSFVTWQSDRPLAAGGSRRGRSAETAPVLARQKGRFFQAFSKGTLR